MIWKTKKKKIDEFGLTIQRFIRKRLSADK